SWWSRIIPAQKPLFSTRNSRRLPTKKIRQAFAYSINRQMLIDNILQTGVPPAYGWVPTSMGLTGRLLQGRRGKSEAASRGSRLC
ncbi:hypothetical protein ACEQ6C_39690, partial [Rhizobium ruizarguesonis]